MYLIIGASGYLGRYCIKNILENTSENVIATFSEDVMPEYKNPRLEWKKLDVTSVEALKEIAKFVNEETKIIYLAAFHHPDKVEEMPELAWNINIVALANAINLFRKAKCFYYSSTDTVYGEGGLDILFKEDDKTDPVNLYGKHKALAEQITLASNGNVVRFPFIIGTSLVEGRPHFFDNLMNDIKNGKVVEMFDDSYRSTLSFNQCAKFLVQIIEKFGACDEKIINISSDNAMSKYDVVLKMCEDFNLDKSFVKPISINNCEGIFKAKRAKSAILDNTKLKKLLNIEKIELEF